MGGRLAGYELLRKVNDDSLAYEGRTTPYASSIRAQAATVYEGNEKMLHGFNDELKKRDAAAACDK